MHPDRAPLFCDTALAARVERAEVDLISAAAEAAHERRDDERGFLLPIAGGVASFADDGSPYNKVTGLGFAGVPRADELDEIERAFTDRGEPTQVELAHLADPDIAAVLTTRGYRLESFENVLGRALDGRPGLPAPPGIEVRRSGDDEFEAWLSVVADSVARPDVQGLPWHEEFPRETYELAERDALGAGVLRYAAFRGGLLAGGASLRLTDGIAQFAGAATTPAHRRHGVQTALLTARLADAAAAGCDLAVIVTQPGSKSQQNAQRRGFDLLYTRAILVKNLRARAAGST
ncbi:GNAT family N-acetyltransferase [Pseudonocardia halophobica]|uniref:GNAT family acetyltransferase n=1 Tax=Pseudonocardia halophobica TaxID=29401 RepID=A0A9W6NUE4_9PSEU|nr:GNAT family N-acetyltransferase [Pseudonocardia halophobica]GLL09341.1 GNAT family acetyltransferase [Pseudonocardia halophobica]